MTVICVVQARMGSTRLPGKVLADLGGRTMLALVLRRLAAAPVDGLVVSGRSAVERCAVRAPTSPS